MKNFTYIGKTQITIIEPTEQMIEQLAIGLAAGHALAEFKMETDKTDKIVWVARCPDCEHDVTIWPSGLVYSFLGDTCE